ncbi:MAG: MATE family efflux transporter [Faecalibacterium sp.]
MAKRVNLLSEPILSTLIKLSLPLMGMSCIQMAYNLTDMFWIGRLGAGAVASVGTGGLLVWFCTGLHTISQLGGQVYVAQNIGAGDMKKAGQYATASMTLSTILTVILGLIFFFGTTPIVSFFQLNDPTVVADAEIYIKVTCGFIFFMLLSKLLTALITTTGDSKTPFIATTIGLVFNIILDPILIFGYLGAPALGVLGAAYATVFAQMVVFALLFIQVLRGQHLFAHVSLKNFPALPIFKDIVKLGLPTTLQATFFPTISMFISRLVAGFGDEAVAVQRIGSQVESVSWMTAEGFATAVNSFMGQNYGARNGKRTKDCYYQAATMLIVIGLFNTALLILGAEAIFNLFVTEPEVIAMGATYLVILGISQVFMCLEILSSSAMNALGQTLMPATVSIVFTGMRIPLALMLTATVLGLSGIWWSIAISTIFKGILLAGATVWILRQPKYTC